MNPNRYLTKRRVESARLAGAEVPASAGLGRQLPVIPAGRPPQIPLGVISATRNNGGVLCLMRRAPRFSKNQETKSPVLVFTQSDHFQQLQRVGRFGNPGQHLVIESHLSLTVNVMKLFGEMDRATGRRAVRRSWPDPRS